MNQAGLFDFRPQISKIVSQTIEIPQGIHEANEDTFKLLKQRVDDAKAPHYDATPYHFTKELLSYFPVPQSDESIVLDLGCGDGTLLQHLRQEKNTDGYGLESDEDNILKCIESGVNVIEQFMGIAHLL